MSKKVVLWSIMKLTVDYNQTVLVQVCNTFTMLEVGVYAGVTLRIQEDSAWHSFVAT